MVPIGERAAVELEAHRCGLPRVERHPLIAAQLLWRLARRRRIHDVELGDVGPAPPPRIRDPRGDGPARPDLETRVAEGRVREPEAERESRLDVVRVVPAVADV